MADAPVDEILLYRRQPWLFVIACVIMLLVVSGQIILIAYDETDSFDLQSLRAFAIGYPEKMAQKPALAVLLVTTSIAFVIYMVVQTVILWKSRLILGASGIRYQSPLPAWLRALDSSWTINWADVRTIRIASSLFDTTLGQTLTIDDASQRRKLSVFGWTDAEHRHKRLGRALRHRKIKPEVWMEALEQQSIMQYLRARGVEVDIQLGRAATRLRGFDLGSNRHAVIALLLLAALTVYAAIEVMLPGKPVSPNMPLLGESVGAGILIAIIFTIWLRKSKVPVFESVAIAISLGGASGAVLYLALRNVV